MKETVQKRPTETATGLGSGLLVYGFCTQVGLPPLAAAIIAVVTAVVPLAVSGVVDALRSSRRDADNVAHVEGGRPH